MGGFMKKEELLQHAERLGVNLEGLSWPQQQKAVMEARQAAGEDLWSDEEKAKMSSNAKARADAEKAQRKSMMPPIQEPKDSPSADPEVIDYAYNLAKSAFGIPDDADKDWRNQPIPQDPVVIVPSTLIGSVDIYDMERFGNKTILISPEIAPQSIQLVKYDEVLQEDLDIEEVSLVDDFNLNKPINFDNNNVAKTTYRIKGNTGQKVIAQSTIPKENSQITFRPRIDLVPVSKFGMARGYLWTHQTYPNVKALLIASGFYEEYKERFTRSGVQFYTAGLLCVDINTTHAVFKEIERKVKQRKMAGLY